MAGLLVRRWVRRLGCHFVNSPLERKTFDGLVTLTPKPGQFCGEGLRLGLGRREQCGLGSILDCVDLVTRPGRDTLRAANQGFKGGSGDGVVSVSSQPVFNFGSKLFNFRLLSPVGFPLRLPDSVNCINPCRSANPGRLGDRVGQSRPYPPRDGTGGM